MSQKILIYQVLPRLFGNTKSLNKVNGSIEENGSGKFSTFSTKVLDEIKAMGFTHIWYTGILEHATRTDYSKYGIRNSHPGTVKGNAGSPYAIRDYYDVSPDLVDHVESRMSEFEALIGRTHSCGMKAIIDLVPNHVAREYFSDAKPAHIADFGANDRVLESFDPNNNFYYVPGHKFEPRFPVVQGDDTYIEFPVKATGNDLFDPSPTVNDWYDTVKLNYGIDYCRGRACHFDPKPDTWFKMRNILLYWAGKGVDGFRCDMVEMVPVEFWHWVIPEIKSKFPHVVFIAEIYNPAEYRNYINYGNFDYLYDKVGLYDCLRDIVCGRRPASDITTCWQRNEGIQDRMLNFLENHDEQRIASSFFAGNPFKAIPAMVIAATMNTNPVMIYAGQELGEPGMYREGFSGLDGRTSIFDYWSVDSLRTWYNNGNPDGKNLTVDQEKLRQFYTVLLQLCNNEACICNGRFYDLMYANPQFDSNCQYACLRCHDHEFILVAVNFSDKAATVHVNIPEEAFNYMDINRSDLKRSTDLLTGNKQELAKFGTDPFWIEMEALSGKLLKFG
ncbi:MAG: alpha-amylase family protein [Bacteroidales bacterium]|jgi:glycosidase|nr:alpha-amylase family protein [Bacteroidales bacterium]